MVRSLGDHASIDVGSMADFGDHANCAHPVRGLVAASIAVEL